MLGLSDNSLVATCLSQKGPFDQTSGNGIGASLLACTATSRSLVARRGLTGALLSEYTKKLIEVAPFLPLDAMAAFAELNDWS